MSMYSRKPTMFQKDDLPGMLKELEENGGFSDAYFSVGEPVLFKRRKKMYRFTHRALKEEELKQFLLRATSDNSALAAIQTGKKGLSGAFSVSNKQENYHYRYRYEATTGRDGRGKHTVALDVRSLSSKPVPIEKQGVADELRKALICKENGLVLIGGATGSGKTTLLSGVIDDAATSGTDDRVIRTIEDPIEIVYDDRKRYGNNSVKQREIGKDFLSFGLAVRSFLRQGPTDILVGEMRDLETIQETLKAANTGHRVFGTIHVNTVADIPARIVSEFPEESRRGRMIELLSISKLWMVQRLEVNPKGGLTALRSHLKLTPELTNSFFSVSPDNIRSFANDLLEEHGVPMHEAARLAYESGDIEKITYEKIKWGA